MARRRLAAASLAAVATLALAACSSGGGSPSGSGSTAATPVTVDPRIRERFRQSARTAAMIELYRRVAGS